MKINRASICIYGVGYLFNVLLYVVALLIPLYGVSISLQISYIGLLLSLPAVFQVLLRLFGGVLTDYLGEKRSLILTFSSCLLAGVAFSYSYLSALAALMIGQVFMGIARSIYWTASQSYTSRIPGLKPEKALGNLNGAVNAGKFSGILLSGWLIQLFGYETAFKGVIWIALLGLLIAFLLTNIPKKELRKKNFMQSISLIRTALKYKPLQLGAITAFIAGIIVSLTDSFYPIWLSKDLAYDEGIISLILAMRGVGAVVTGILFGFILAKIGHRNIFVFASIIAGTIFLFIPFYNNIVIIMIMVVFIGLISGLVQVFYQFIAVEHSGEDNRGVALSTVGLTWSLAFLVGPFLFGMLIDKFGTQLAFSTLGLIFVIFSVFTGKIFDYFINSQRQQDGARLDLK